MKILLPTFIFIFLLVSCGPAVEKKLPIENKTTPTSITKKFYSKSVNDTFTVFISLPNEYDPKKNIKYPVVYLLDANLYFDIVSPLIKKYSEVGLLSPCILVGIGYKDFNVMDSLRNRDYTFPVAIPEYEMSVSGRADKFSSFVNNELISDIDSNYSVDKTNRILMGHSLGGYFTLYALNENLKNKNNIFSSYIAASPSTHYNHNFILKEFEKLNIDNENKTKLYVTFGGIEDGEEGDSTFLKSDKIILSLTKSLKEKNKLNFKGDLFSNLGHMDTPLPTFVKGMQWALNKPE